MTNSSSVSCRWNNHKKFIGSGRPFGVGQRITISIITKEEMEYITKIVESLKGSGLLIKGVSKTIENEAKEQQSGFISMLLSILAASLFGHLLSGKGVIKVDDGVIQTGQGPIRAEATATNQRR